MRTRLLTAFAFVFLGCSGITESMVEMSTGGTMEITEDGVRMEMPDGSVVVSRTGANVEVPEDFPLPLPQQGTLESITETTTASGQESVMLTYKDFGSTDETQAFYMDALTEAGANPEEKDESMAGISAVMITGEIDGKRVVVQFTSVLGQDNLTLTYGQGQTQ